MLYMAVLLSSPSGTIHSVWDLEEVVTVDLPRDRYFAIEAYGAPYVAREGTASRLGFYGRLES